MRFLKKELTKAYTLVHVRRETRAQQRSAPLERKKTQQSDPEPATK